jgi:hypothetical protein
LTARLKGPKHKIYVHKNGADYRYAQLKTQTNNAENPFIYQALAAKTHQEKENLKISHPKRAKIQL